MNKWTLQQIAAILDKNQEALRDLEHPEIRGDLQAARELTLALLEGPTDLTSAIESVRQEALRQDLKWGANRDHHAFEWLAILSEEVGETAQAALHTMHGGEHAGTVRAELVQVAAVALQWIANIDRCGGAKS